MFLRNLLCKPYFCLVLTRVCMGDGISTMSTNSQTDASTLTTRRLTAVSGFDGRENDVIFCGKAEQPAKQNVIFFGGDVQVIPHLCVDSCHLCAWLPLSRMS